MKVNTNFKLKEKKWDMENKKRGQRVNLQPKEGEKSRVIESLNLKKDKVEPKCRQRGYFYSILFITPKNL